MSQNIDPRAILLLDPSENEFVLSNVRKSVIALLQQHGELAVTPDVVDYLTNLAIHFMSDLSTQAGEIHRNGNTPFVHHDYIRHIVRSNPQMIQILDERFPRKNKD